jgi:alcohol dehydrogenase (cytochrome c)
VLIRVHLWLIVFCAISLHAQTNPFATDPKAAESGRWTFRIFCAPCHGIRAEGGRGPDLTLGTYSAGDLDKDLFSVIARGVPGSEMPGYADRVDSENIWRLVSYVRSVARHNTAAVQGDFAAGETLFWQKGGCGKCHRVGRLGTAIGPDLTRAGRQRSLAYLRESIVSPDADITHGYGTVRVVLNDGKSIVGVERSFDNFSAQLVDLSGKYYSFVRDNVKSITREPRSLMPSYKTVFTEPELADLLTYLVRQPMLPPAGFDNSIGGGPAQNDPNTWTSYGKNPLGWRYSDLDQINTQTVSRLVPQWTYQTNIPGKNETTPLVFDRKMFITGPSNNAWALDALTGRPIWSYKSAPPPGLIVCCGQVNRGFAAQRNKLFKVNLEGTLIALDEASGAVIWTATLEDYKKGYSATAAPIVAKNLVVTGMAGAEFGTRGFIDAYEINSGTRVWRFYTVAGAGEPGAETWSPIAGHSDAWQRGGGATWITGTYDPELNLIYWGTGNPGPDMDGDVRPGDNLYTCSVVALDADTGKLKWHYQFTPHDVHDWDAVADPVAVDLNLDGHPVKALIQANRNGYFYVLDRTNGKVLHTKAYTKVTWADGIAPNGRPVLIPGQDPTEEGNMTCPGMGGGHNWQATAYSPQTGFYYFTSTERCMPFYKTKQDYIEGQWYQASTVDRGGPGGGRLLAVDPKSGNTVWQFDTISSPTSGVLATAGGLVFAGDAEGYLIAFDARTGKVLWRFQTGGPVWASPISYALDGRQYIAVAAGQTMLTFALLL